jgi:hypothetical protein
MDDENPNTPANAEENPRPPANRRLLSAMAAYAVLAGLAFLQLHGKVLYAVLILFGGLAAKTVIADKAGWR